MGQLKWGCREVWGVRGEQGVYGSFDSIVGGKEKAPLHETILTNKDSVCPPVYSVV